MMRITSFFSRFLLAAIAVVLAAVPVLGLDLGTLNLDKLIDRASSAIKVGETVSKSAENFTPSQEHYIGRTVSAMVLGRYRPLLDNDATYYVNLLGQTLAQAADQPETYTGYHFLLLDTEEINAFAAPGGLIFVTRGLLRCCQSEDDLAAVLAHEIGHVQRKHGLQTIKKSRLKTAFSTVWDESATILDNQKLGQVTGAFGGTIDDITGALFNGYSRSAELEADQDAVTILRRVGYDPNGLVSMLMIMEQRFVGDRTGFAKTHPAPADRIAAVRQVIGRYNPVSSPAVRQQRFLKFVGRS